MHQELIKELKTYNDYESEPINNNDVLDNIKFLKQSANEKRQKLDSLQQQEESLKFQLQTTQFNDNIMQKSSPVTERSLSNSHTNFQDNEIQKTNINDEIINQRTKISSLNKTLGFIQCGLYSLILVMILSLLI